MAVLPSEKVKNARCSKNVKRILVFLGCILFLIIIVMIPPMYFWMTERSLKKLQYPCHINLSVPISNPKFFSNGSVLDGEQLYPEGHHFNVGNITRACMCKQKPCIRKCCKLNEFYVKRPRQKAQCEKNADLFTFDNFTLHLHKTAENVSILRKDDFQILYGDVCWKGKYRLDPVRFKGDDYTFLSDGRILVGDQYKDASQYCMETRNGSTDISVFLCFEDNISTSAQFTLYPIGLIVSIPFIIATFFVYALLTELQNLHGKTLMCHSVSMLAAYTGLAILQIATKKLSHFWCIFVAFLVQFSFLASFFWLNVMCFDIWWVFSGLRPPRGSAKERDNKKFLFYSLYAWGVPLIIFIITFIMDFVEDIPDTYIKPGFGATSCWFKTKDGTLLYFYLPIGIIVLLNITMFLTTALKLQAHTKDTKVLHGSESRRSESDKDRFHLYLKLFIVMGINWVMELVSFFVGGPKSIWFVTDIGNTLQGVLIFLIFVCKRRIFRLLNQKLCPRWDLVGVSSTASTATTKVGSRNTSTTTTISISKDTQDLPMSITCANK